MTHFINICFSCTCTCVTVAVRKSYIHNIIFSFLLDTCILHIYKCLCSLSIPPFCAHLYTTLPPSSLAFSFSDTEKPTPPSLSHAFTYPPTYSLGTQIPISPSLTRSVVFIVFFNPPISVKPPGPPRV